MITKLSEVWPGVERAAHVSGAIRVGASDLSDEHVGLFEDWIATGHHATMEYLAKNRAVRRDPSARFPWAKSVIVILVPYAAERPDAPAGSLSHHVARYALGDDYHEVLDRILRKIEAALPSGVKSRRYVDTGPLSDRSYAAQAGLGWIGKNGMLIDEERGSYFFIGTLLTSLENDIASATVADRCGSCTRCIDACPTNKEKGMRTLGEVAAKGKINSIDAKVFLCAIYRREQKWQAAAPLLDELIRRFPRNYLLRFEQADFSRLFRKSAVKRARLDGVKRNVEALYRAL